MDKRNSRQTIKAMERLLRLNTSIYAPHNLRPSLPVYNASTTSGLRLGRPMRCWRPRSVSSVHQVACCGLSRSLRGVFPLLCSSPCIVTCCFCDSIFLSLRLLKFLRSFFRGPEPFTLFPRCDGPPLSLHAKHLQIVPKASDIIPLSSGLLSISPTKSVKHLCTHGKLYSCFRFLVGN